MDELGNSVENISNSAIKLSEAAADLGALKVIFGVFLVMVLILFLLVIFNEITYKRKIVDLSESVQQITRYFDTTAQLFLNKIRSKQLLIGAYKGIAVSIKFEIVKSRLLSSEEDLIGSAKSIASYILYQVKSSFDGIRTQGGFLSENIEITSEIISEVLVKYGSLSKDQFNISDMDRDIDLLIKGYEQRVSKKFSTDID